MTVQEFEQLLSSWLDEPQRQDLAATVEHAAAANPALARLREQYVRLERLARSLPGPKVDWTRLCQRISAAVDEAGVGEAAEDARLDEQLRQLLPEISTRVDWHRLRDRLVAAVVREDARRRAARRTWRLVGAGGLLAAAACVTLWVGVAHWSVSRSQLSSPRNGVRANLILRVALTPPARPGPTAGVCLVRAEIIAPGLRSKTQSGPVVVRSAVSATPDDAGEIPHESAVDTGEDSKPELFFVQPGATLGGADDPEELVVRTGAGQTHLC